MRLNSNVGVAKLINGSVNANSNTTVTLPSVGSYILVVYHVYGNVNGMYIVNVYTGTYGTYRVLPILPNSVLTVENSSDLDVKLTNASGTKANYAFLRVGSTM